MVNRAFNAPSCIHHHSLRWTINGSNVLGRYSSALVYRLLVCKLEQISNATQKALFFFEEANFSNMYQARSCTIIDHGQKSFTRATAVCTATCLASSQVFGRSVAVVATRTRCLAIFNSFKKKNGSTLILHGSSLVESLSLMIPPSKIELRYASII
jgi:hypothetical protein